MSQGILEITDKDGWRKDFPLSRTVTYIGSDPSSDIVLETWHGGGVSARHLQLISLAAEGQGYRLVNLGDTEAGLGASGDKLVAPRSFSPMSDGDRIRLGDFRLVFRAGEVAPVASPVAASGGVAGGSAPSPISSGQPLPSAAVLDRRATSAVIGLRLSLPSVQLAADRSLEGTVVVSNLGNKPGVQFKLQVQDWESDCYDIGPGPVLFPGVEKSVLLRLRHPRRPKPPAGEHRFSVRATAPDAYPGESAVVAQVIHIAPFYHHKLRLVS